MTLCPRAVSPRPSRAVSSRAVTRRANLLTAPYLAERPRPLAGLTHLAPLPHSPWTCQGKKEDKKASTHPSHLLHERCLVQHHALGLGASALISLSEGTSIAVAHVRRVCPVLWTNTLLLRWWKPNQPQALQEGLGGGGPEKPAKRVQCC